MYRLFIIFLILSSPSFSQNDAKIVLPIGHSNGVNSVEYSPDGKLLLSSSSDGTAKVWDVKSGKLLHDLSGHMGDLFDAQFSKDGKMILTASQDRTVRIWDAKTGLMVESYTVFSDDEKTMIGARRAFFGDNGDSIFVLTDRKVVIIDRNDKKTIREFRNFRRDFVKMSVCPDYKHLIVSNYTDTARIYNVVTGEIEYIITGKPDNVMDAQYSPDGNYIVTTGNGNELRVLDAGSGEIIKKVKMPETVTWAEFSPDGKYIVTANTDIKNAFIVDVVKCKIQSTLNGHWNNITQAVFCPPDKSGRLKVVTSSWDGSAIIWDIMSGDSLFYCEHTNEEDRMYGQRNHAKCVAVSPDGKYYACGTAQGIIKIWETGTGKLVHSLKGYSNNIECAGFISDGKNDGSYSILTQAWGEMPQVWSLSAIRPLVNITGRYARVNNECSTPDGKYILSYSKEDSTCLWETATGELIIRYNGSGGLDKPTLSTDGKLFASKSLYNEQFTWVYETHTGKLLYKFKNYDLEKRYTNNSVVYSFSPDAIMLAVRAMDSVKIWNLVTGKMIVQVLASSSFFSPDGKYAVLANKDGTIKRWNIESAAFVDIENVVAGLQVDNVCFSPDGKYFAIMRMDQKAVFVWESAVGKIIHQLPMVNETEEQKVGIVFHSSVEAFYPDGKSFITVCSDINKVQRWDVTTGKMMNQFFLNDYPIENAYGHCFQDIDFRSNRFIAKYNSSITINDLNTGEEILHLVPLNEGDYFIKTRDNYYASSRNAMQMVSFKIDDKLYSFEQFDLKYNRPDIVLSRLGYADSAVIAAYHQACIKRLKKMNFTEEMLKEDFNLPEIEIKNFEYLPAATEEDTANIELNLNDNKYKLDRVNIFINDVPVYGTAGIDLRKYSTQKYLLHVHLKLAYGVNKVQVSVLNQAGAESYRETFYVTCNKPSGKPDLYLLSIGVSRYSDNRYDLTYADKDAEDIVKLFVSGSGFGNIYKKTIMNEQATKENIISAQDFLMPAGINDEVIMFIAGHGVLDDKLDYYLAAYDMDFSNPSKTGIPYETVEGLLDGIAPLKKVLFIDACHSGEIDKDELAMADGSANNTANVLFRKVGADIKPRLGSNNTYDLVKTLFADLRKGTGTTIISSAGGMESAMESGEWKNGLFTYCLINGIRSGSADLNKDGKIMLSELQKFVQDQVTILSGGLQQPTSRMENREGDFNVW